METTAPERFFYHSFPRPRPSAGDQTRKGLQILRSMCRNGLLLVPERVSWTDPTGTRPGDRIHALQRRISFTELAPHELRAHAETFGPFALEYRIADLRALGVLPVIYVPDSTSRDPTLDWTGASLLARLADATQIVEGLVETQQLTAPTIEMDLRLREGGLHTRKFDEQETAAIRDYLAFIQGAPGQRLTEILGALRSLTSLFYPTEHPQYTGLLGYYRQREWRLFSGAFLAGQPTTNLTPDQQRRELLEIDPDFFSRTLPFPEGEATLAVKSHYMAAAGQRNILSIANHIVVPTIAQEEADRIVNEHGLNVPIVRLEDLPAG
jgi:hypothetical protein